MRGFGSTAEFAVGSVTGARWWNLDLSRGRPELQGMYERSRWLPGENAARCPGSLCPPRHPRCTCPAEQIACDVPCECGRCGCGFWAYWLMDAVPEAQAMPVPVLGVIEGYGTTTIGDKGFRCAKARIVGIHMPPVTDKTLMAGPGNVPPQHWFPAVRQMTDPGDLAEKTLLELLLGSTYGVPVYSSPEMLLAAHPPTTDYLPVT
jgi:hypothetical protein